MNGPNHPPCSIHSVTKGLMATYATRQLMWSVLDLGSLRGPLSQSHPFKRWEEQGRRPHCHSLVMHLSIVHICYGGSEACPKFDMLLIGAKFSQQHGADHNEKKKKLKRWQRREQRLSNRAIK